MTLWHWFKSLVTLNPHLWIGGTTHPYMKRWYLIPRNRLFNIYLHKFIRDDDDRALHDHPWWFVSIMLWGSYIEWTRPKDVLVSKLRRFGSIAFRAAKSRHRVTLPNQKPCWTLVFTGPKQREWGFWCPNGFIVWHKFTKPGNKGEIGKGCDQ